MSERFSFLFMSFALGLLTVSTSGHSCKKELEMKKDCIENAYYRIEFTESQIILVELKDDHSLHRVSEKGLFTVIQAPGPKAGVGYCGEYLFNNQFNIFNYTPTHFTGELTKINQTTLQAQYNHPDFKFTTEISLDGQDIVEKVSLLSMKETHYAIVLRSWFFFDEVDYAPIPGNVYRNPYLHARAPVGLDASGYEMTRTPILYQERIVPMPMTLVGKNGYYYTLFSDKTLLGEYREQKTGFGLVDYDGKACPIIAIYPFGSWNRSVKV